MVQITMVCACGAEFLAERVRRKYCSRSCSTRFLKPHKGKKHSEEAKMKMRQKKLGKPAYPEVAQLLRTMNLGKTLSDEHKKRISLAHLGTTHSPETLVKLRGSNHYRWRGGVTTENKRIRGSLGYARWRKAVFERDDFTCQICLKRGGKIQADHIKPFALFPELRLDLSNGRTLCVPCHRKTDTYGFKTKTYEFLRN